MRVMAFASLNNVPFSRSVASKALSNVFASQQIQVEMPEVVQTTADFFGVTTEQIRGSGRARDIVLPRQVAMYLTRELTGHSLPEIGQYFGRDHSTVMHAINKVTNTLRKDGDLALKVSQVREGLTNLHEARLENDI